MPSKLIGFTGNLTTLDERCYKNITVMIYLIFMQYMKHRMQVMQEHWEYDLMTNPVKFVQQMCNKRLHHCQKVTD